MAIPANAIKLTAEQEKAALIPWAQRTIDFSFMVKSVEIERPLTEDGNAFAAHNESLQLAHDFWDASILESERKGKDPIRIIYCRKVLDFCASDRGLTR
jgi:hypothetical protein